MDNRSTYRELIKRILTEYANLTLSQPVPGTETLLAFDDEHDQYLWLRVGWLQQRRVQGITVHVRLINGKIQIEQDWTEDGIATELIRAGVPREDIVLAFHEPFLQQSAALLAR
jgi:XisI protein